MRPLACVLFLSMLSFVTSSSVTAQGHRFRDSAVLDRPFQLLETERMLPSSFAGILAGVPLDASRAVAADFDGDGDQDFFRSGGLEPGRVHWNTGLGAFRAGPQQLGGGVTSAPAVLAVDVNADGMPDIVASEVAIYTGLGLEPTFTPRLRLFLNLGNGLFREESQRLPDDGQLTMALASEDLDGDADQDLVLGNTPLPMGSGPAVVFTGGQNRVLINDGAGFFSEDPVALPQRMDATGDVLVADFNGDGAADIFQTEGASPFFGFTPTLHDRVLLNDGQGRFQELPDATGLPARISVQASLEDFNGDAFIDIALAHQDQHFFVLLGQGTGFFQALRLGGGVGTPQTRSYLSGDFDVDGDTDLIRFRRSVDAEFWENNGLAGFTQSTAQLPPFLPGFGRSVVVDVDADQDPDVVMAKSLLLNDGQGQLIAVEATQAEVDLPNPSLSTAADLDRDGDLDLLSLKNSFRFYLSDGLGGYEPKEVARPAGPLYAVHDLIGDGAPEFLVGGDLFELDDNLDLVQVSTVFNDVPVAVGPGDFDQDGDTDLFLSITPSLYVILFNEGAGVFLRGAFVSTGFNCNGRVLAEDLDQDGDVDVLLESSSEGFCFLRNEGTAGFVADLSAFPTSRPFSSQVVDLDRDGDLDVLYSDFSSGGLVRALINDGAGGFLQTLDFDQVASPPVVLDVDSDGYPDLIGADGRLHRNDRSLGFVREGRLPLPTGLPGDFDGDGDVDLFASGFPQDPRVVLHNLTRHVAWRELPRIGKALRMDVYGPGNEPFALALSLGTDRRSLGRRGVLRLDLERGYRRVASGRLDPGGHATVEIDVPNQLALVGFTVNWQALVGNVPRFTNLSQTTFQDL